jgi:regulator of replication initiation timing
MITTEEAERLARWCDTDGFTERATALRSLAAERDALRAENARLREALQTARRDAREDCAKWHDEVASEYKKESQLLYEAKDWTVAYVFAQGYVINNKRAAAIRALGGEGNE